MQKNIKLIQGDITRQHTDAIVNAANSSLMGGGGVDGAIHRRGGSAIMQETNQRYPDGCPTGSAVISAAGRLPARYVIHAVGPVWQGGQAGEADQLAAAYQKSLELAVKYRCLSVAFPALSAGTYGYPIDEAARIGLRTVIDQLTRHRQPKQIQFVLFSPGSYGAFAAALEVLIM